MTKISIYMKCNECGKEIPIAQAKKSWIWTRNQNIYCPNCVISLKTKLEKQLKGGQK